MRQSTEELTNEIANSNTMEHWSEEKTDSIDEITLAEYLERMLEKYHLQKYSCHRHCDAHDTLRNGGGSGGADHGTY